LRGGSWNNNPQNLRSANRNRNNTENRNNNIGFRVASTTAARAARITVFAGVHGSSRAVHDDHGRGKWFAPVTALVPVLGDVWAPAGAKVTFGSLTMSMNARRTGPAVEAHYRFLEWLIPTVEKFPRAQKFLLGDRIQQTALDVLEDLIEAPTHANGARISTAPIWALKNCASFSA
jgi:hypothetical protein